MGLSTIVSDENPVVLNVASIGPLRGTYILVLRVCCPVTIGSSRLGNWEALPGFYLYVGSALGSGGLRARLSHHLRPNARFHWHVDYLTHSGNIEEIWYSSEPGRWEHEWAGALAGIRGASIACPRFGASDCRCASHLYHFRKKPSADPFGRLLKQLFPDHPPLHVLRKKRLSPISIGNGA